MRVLFVENDDSFSFNVVDLLPEGALVVPARLAAAQLEAADVVVVGPGPTDPVRAGLVSLVTRAVAAKKPVLGICLGHQARGLAFGATLARSTPAHGKVATMTASGSRFLPDGRHEVMRYHSLSLSQVPAPLRVVARLDDGTVMAVEHEALPLLGLQFHPDSYATPRGREYVDAFFAQLGAPIGPGTRTTPRRPAPRPAATPASGHLTLASLEGARAFALLGPGYFDDGRWRRFHLEAGGDAALWLAPYDGRPARVQGRLEPVEVLLSPATAPGASLDDAAFEAGVARIRERIAAGDVYQVNLTVRAGLDGVSGASLLSRLCQRAVPRFAAWVRLPGLGELVSASPELLVETSAGWAHAEPMKGTAPVGERAALLASRKDEAELAMITDLTRNDLQQLCGRGTVQVTSPRRLVELPYVLQAVSDVEGALREGVTTDDVLKVMHPGGSVTGAPRPAAIAVIDELEPTARRFYCGTLGVESAGGFRAALLIRTATRLGDGWEYGVGSGITWDSAPAAELAEVRLKLGAL